MLYEQTVDGEEPSLLLVLVRRDGAPGGNRTPDPLLRRQTLYPLSYGRAVCFCHPIIALPAFVPLPWQSGWRTQGRRNNLYPTELRA